MSTFHAASGRYTKDRKYEKGQERCRGCNVLLVPGPVKDKATNIAPSRLKKADYICRVCNAATKKRNQADMKSVLKAHEEGAAKSIREMNAGKPKVTLEDMMAADKERRRKANSLMGFLEQEENPTGRKRKRRKAYVPEPRKPAPGEDPNDQSIAAIINRKLGTVKVRPPELVSEMTSEQLDDELKKALTELRRTA